MRKAQKVDFIDALAGVFKPRPEQSVVDWAEGQYSLSTIASGTAGRYSTSITPYVREIINLFSDFEVERVVKCFGAQTAKTQSDMAGLGWFLAHEPSPAMWVMPNKQLAAAFSESRLQPFLFSSPDIQELKPKSRFAIKKTEMNFDSCILTLVGSNSPANLSSRPVRLLILDEVDKFKQQTSREANAIALAIQRTRTFAEPKILMSSTPTIWDGEIWQEFLNGDQRRWFVPCPFCGEHIVLTLNPDKSAFKKRGYEAKLCWDPAAKRPNGEWDKEMVAKTAHFECPHCKGKITERYKMQMNRGGQWRPTNADYCDPKVRSYHLPTFYAPWKQAGWGVLANEFLKAKKSLDGLRDYLNSVCAEPDMGQYEGGSAAHKELVIAEVSEAAPKGSARIMTVDVQKDHFWFVIREWQASGASILLRWGRADSYEDLREQEQKSDVKFVGLDSGFEAAEVYAECARYGWFACRGDIRETWPNKKRVQVPYNIRVFDPMIGTKEQGKKNIAELRWSNPRIKDTLARLRDRDTAPVPWGVAKEYATDEYFRHLDGEYKRRVADPRTGKVSQQWVLRNSRWPNHIFDCECMSIAVAMYLGFLKATETTKSKDSK